MILCLCYWFSGLAFPCSLLPLDLFAISLPCLCFVVVCFVAFVLLRLGLDFQLFFEFSVSSGLPRCLGDVFALCFSSGSVCRKFSALVENSVWYSGVVGEVLASAPWDKKSDPMLFSFKKSFCNAAGRRRAAPKPPDVRRRGSRRGGVAARSPPQTRVETVPLCLPCGRG